MKDLNGKVVIVTGSSKGIGRETALEAARAGCRVILHGRDLEALSEIGRQIDSIDGEYHIVSGDIRSEEDVASLVNKTNTRFGQIDALVNNAGISARGWFWEQESEVLQTVLDVNVFGSWLVTKHVLPYLEKTKGSVIMVSSMAGIRGIPLTSAYSASKMAQASIAQALRTELHLANSPVHVGIVYVGITANDPSKTVMGPNGQPEELRDRNRRVHSQEQVAKCIINSIRNRKNVAYVDWRDAMLATMMKYFPGLTERVLRASRKTILERQS